jgi:NTE family protein
MMFVVVDAGRGLSGDWANRLEGPNGLELLSAAAGTAIDASVRSSFTAFSVLINDWTVRVQHWRCGLSEADRARLALPTALKCNDVNTFVDRVSFGRLGQARAAILDAIATRLVLPSPTPSPSTRTRNGRVEKPALKDMKLPNRPATK